MQAVVKPLALGTKQIAPVGLGTWSYGDKTWGYKDSDMDDIRAAWKTTLANGIELIDTASIYGYGKSEQIIGQLLRETPESEKKNVVLATKWLPVPSPVNWFLFTPAMVSSLRASLERLGVDSVDLYQIHGAIGFHSWETQGAHLAKCVKLGLTKQVGVSNFNKEQVIKMHDILARHGVKLASNQIEFNLLRTLPESSGLLSAMRERNIACLAYSPLGQGRLTGKYSASNPPPSGRKFSNIPMEEIEPLLEVMRGIAKKYDVTCSAVALNWIVAKGAIPIPGARNAKQAEQNAKALTFNLTAEEVDQLSAKAMTGKTSFWQHG